MTSVSTTALTADCDSSPASFFEIDYWNALITDDEAAAFTGLSVRGLQDLRQRGGGPKFVMLSSRCLRYRRADLKAWADEKVRTSTADAATRSAA